MRIANSYEQNVKRAGFKVGIGVELYTPIFIYVPYKDAKNVENYTAKTDTYNGKTKYKTYTKFSVEKIDTSEDKVIKQLSIINDKGKRVFLKTDKKKEEENK